MDSEKPRALLSVWDKTGIVDFATSLSNLGFEIISTGGTARKLKEAGLQVKVSLKLRNTLKFSMVA